MNARFDERPSETFGRGVYSRVADEYANKTTVVTAQSYETLLGIVNAGAETALHDVASGPGLLTALAAK